MSPAEIISPKQLLVEGNDALKFFEVFLKELGLGSHIQLHNFRGNPELRPFLKQFVLAPGFEKVISLAIVRDAEDGGAENAFKSVCGSLKNAGLDIPYKPQQKSSGNPATSVFIFPDNTSGGMMESLFLRAVESEPSFQCVVDFIECTTKVTGLSPKPRDKAMFLAYLATKPRIKPVTGHAANAGYLNFNSAAYSFLKEFLQAI